MTICIPKWPFEILAKIGILSIMFSWIAFFIVVGYILYVKDYDLYGGISIFLAGGVCSFIACVFYLYDVNKEKHWIEWCHK